MDKETKKERIARVIAETIGRITPGKDKGPFYVNREMMRRGGNRPPRYVMTAEDYERLDAQRKFEDDRRKRHGSGSSST